MSTMFVEIPPDVARVTEGMRDTGYTFETAVADIVDNSIAASATAVDIRMAIDFDGSVRVSVADNGHGMDAAALQGAMRYGAPKRPSPKSLGKFGLGLKTASTAFCRRLSVISRADAIANPGVVAWDLDGMAKRNSWSLEVGDADKNDVALLDAVAPDHSGTVVLWERVDRLLEGYADPTGAPVRRALSKLEDQLRDHLALVYQRFLDSNDPREPTVEIILNGKTVQPWDPFCVAETKAPIAEHTQQVVAPDGTHAQFTVRAFILPRNEEFSSESARKYARVSNERQGIYVYRENRLIHGPDWMGMYKQEPHYSLLRVELSFEHTLDVAFKVDIKKSRILLNETLNDWLRDQFLAGPRREAEKRYRKGAAAAAAGKATLLHAAASNVIQQKQAALTTATVTNVNSTNGTVSLANNAGMTTAKLRILDVNQAGKLSVVTEATLDDGVLWEPTLGENNRAAVALNSGHPFYLKAYLPNKENSTLIQALDYLLWALAQAEVNNISEGSTEAFSEFRVDVSRNLKKLVADLPDAE